MAYSFGSPSVARSSSSYRRRRGSASDSKYGIEPWLMAGERPEGINEQYERFWGGNPPVFGNLDTTPRYGTQPNPMNRGGAPPTTPNMTAQAGMQMPTSGGGAASYRARVEKKPYNMPGWTPADILNPPSLGGDRDERKKGDGSRPKYARGQRGWKPIGMSITTQSHMPGAGTGQYYPGTAAENQNRQVQERIDAFLAEARRVGAPLSQINAGVAAIRSGGSLPANFGSGGGGGSGGMVGDVIQQYQDAMDKANEANERRYQDILAGKYDLLQRQLAAMAGMGQQEMSDLNERYDAQSADILQDMVNRGLSATTPLQTMKMGNERERQGDINRLNERLRRERLDLERGLANDLMGFMERREDVQPDWNQLLQLAMQMGAAGPGGGGGGPALPPMLAGGPIFADAGSMGFGNPMAGIMGLAQPMGYRGSRGSTPQSAAAGRRTYKAGRTRLPRELGFASPSFGGIDPFLYSATA